jgi:hypothetical protein
VRVPMLVEDRTRQARLLCASWMCLLQRSHMCTARNLHHVRIPGEAMNRTRATALFPQKYSSVHRAQTKWDAATDIARSSLYHRLSTPEESTPRCGRASGGWPGAGRGLPTERETFRPLLLGWRLILCHYRVDNTQPTTPW